MKVVIARCVVISGIVLCGFGFSVGLAQSRESSSDRFRVSLARGEVDGVKWGLSATGSKGRPLKSMCAVMTEIAPPEPGMEFAEGSETASCGRLRRADDSINLSSEFRSDDSDATVLRASLYPKNVQMVTFVFAGGQRSTLRARGVKVKNRKAEGVPFFRYLVARFSSGACLQRIVSYDSSTRVINKERGDRSCL
jgi:hypothetical protein